MRVKLPLQETTASLLEAHIIDQKALK